MVDSLLLAVFIFVSTAIILVPLAKVTGLGSVLGYLAAGVLIGPYALGLVSDPETILHFAEFGVVLMLFLIGLELQPRELWAMRSRLVGLGGSQVALTALAIGVATWLAGIPWQSAVVVGLALGLSSTAIVLQIMNERGIMRTETGRSGFAVLLLQDIAVIPIITLIPFLALPELSPEASQAAAEAAAEGSAPENPLDTNEPGWMLALRFIAVFGGMYLAGRFVLQPVMRFIAGTGIREIFTAFALFLVVGAALLMEWLSLSHALGAFIAGVILASSEYRHELESDLNPFKGLLLGLFFISVGMSIEFAVLASEPFVIAAIVIGLVAIKLAILYVLATVFSMSLSNRVLFAILLAQGGEFAFVLFQFALSAGAMEPDLADRLNVAVALTMALTPLLILAFDKLIEPRLIGRGEDPGIPDMGDTADNVMVLGYGRFGQVIARLLHAQGYETTLIDHDPGQIEFMRRFGFKVFYGDVGRLDLLEAAGAAEAKAIIVAINDIEKSKLIVELVKRHFPRTKLYVRAIGRAHAFDLIEMDVDGFERDLFHSSINLGVKVLTGLGYPAHRAWRIAKAFVRHDEKTMIESQKYRHDDEAFMSFVRESQAMLDKVMQADEESAQADSRSGWHAEHSHIDSEAEARRDES